VIAGWRAVVRAVLDAPGSVVMLGAVDVGKTTRAAALANVVCRAGQRVAIVDADTGQSDLGPPTTVGLGAMDRPVHRMAEVQLRAMYFVGDTSPQATLRFLTAGITRLVAKAHDLGAVTIIIDTTGWIRGPAGIAAKLREIKAGAARHVVAIQRAEEVEPILRRLPPGVMVHRLRPHARARRRSSAERRAFRERQFERYFRGGRPRSLDLRALRQERAVTYAGVRIAPADVATRLPAAELRHRLVGLADGAGDLMALGTVTGVRAGGAAMDVLAPPPLADRIAVLQWGTLRVSPAGREERRSEGAA